MIKSTNTKYKTLLILAKHKNLSEISVSTLFFCKTLTCRNKKGGQVFGLRIIFISSRSKQLEKIKFGLSSKLAGRMTLAGLP